METTAYGTALKRPDSVMQLSQSQHKPGSLGPLPRDLGCFFENEYYASKYLAITIPVFAGVPGPPATVRAQRAATCKPAGPGASAKDNTPSRQLTPRYGSLVISKFPSRSR